MSELIEPVEVPQSDFPHSTVSAPGMITLPADVTPRYGTALLGVPYAEKDGCRLHLQVLLPPMAPESNTSYPAVLYVQGSAWFPQNLGQELPALADFARRGYVMAIVEYRPSTVAPFPAAGGGHQVGRAVPPSERRPVPRRPGPDRPVGDLSGGHTSRPGLTSIPSRSNSGAPSTSTDRPTSPG